jgi:hypothetical protein
MVKALRSSRSLVRAPKKSLNFFNLPNPSSRTMTLGFTQEPLQYSLEDRWKPRTAVTWWPVAVHSGCVQIVASNAAHYITGGRFRTFSSRTCCCLDRLCGLVVRVLGYRSGGPGSIPGTTRKKVGGLERDPLSLVSTTEELLDRKVAAPV